MSRTVNVGLDGSPESLAAAEWAASEAALRGMSLKLLYVREPGPPSARGLFLGIDPPRQWADKFLDEAAESIRVCHPRIQISVERRNGRPGEALTNSAGDAALLVLGSRGLSGFAGFILGSVGQSVVARAELPVVLVRDEAAAGGTSRDARRPECSRPPVVLGLDTDSPDDTVLEFAFEAASRRDVALRVLHSWKLSPHYYVYGIPVVPALDAELAAQEAEALAGVLRPWRDRFPGVEVIEEIESGKAADHLVRASRHASLVVVGRRIRRAAITGRIGPVTHAVLHHSTAPVAVVAHK
ncbi:universal stress protein [Streptomyces sp. NPDC006798]|uniref:universal stress protein n=1 Tax=Streptomyces sp. NPDC006798 TaxID=3155462 RepID=UPI0033CE2FF8